MEQEQELFDLKSVMKSVTFDIEATRKLIHDEFGSDSSDDEEIKQEEFKTNELQEKKIEQSDQGKSESEGE